MPLPLCTQLHQMVHIIYQVIVNYPTLTDLTNLLHLIQIMTSPTKDSFLLGSRTQHQSGFLPTLLKDHSSFPRFLNVEGTLKLSGLLFFLKSIFIPQYVLFLSQCFKSHF